MSYIISDPAKIKDLVTEKTTTAKTFGESFRGYISLSAEIAALQESILNGEFPDKSIEQLQKLKVDLSTKYSIFKSSIRRSQLMCSALITEINDTIKFSSEDTTNNRKADVMKKLMLTKKKIEELTNKKKEIQSLNVIIDSFRHKDEFAYTEEELTETFGAENLEKIKTSNSVSKVHTKEKRKKIKVDNDGDLDMSAETNGEEKEEFEEVDVIIYKFRANISKSVPKLKEIQQTLIANIEQLDHDIEEVKRGYFEKVFKFEAIMNIVKGTDPKETQNTSMVKTEERDEASDSEIEADEERYAEGNETTNVILEEEKYDTTGKVEDDDEEFLYNDRG